MAIDEQTDICHVNIKKLQEILAGQNVMIHFSDDLIPKEEMEDVYAGAEDHV